MRVESQDDWDLGRSVGSTQIRRPNSFTLPSRLPDVGVTPAPLPWPVLHRHTLDEDEQSGQLSPVDVNQVIDEARVKQRNLNKWLIFVGVVVLVVFVIVDFTTPEHMLIKRWIGDFLKWIKVNPYSGTAAFAIIYAVTTILFVPGVILTLGAGAAFGCALGIGYGVLLGSVAVTVGAIVGSVFAFLLGRYAMYKHAQRWAKKFKILRAVNMAVEDHGIKLMLLLRLSPLVPYSAFNYVAGLTGVSLTDYIIGCFGVVPGVVAFVFIGASAGNAVEDMNEEVEEEEEEDHHANVVEDVVLVVGIVATVVALVFVTWYARRALRHALEESQEDEKREGEGSSDRAGDGYDSNGEKKCDEEEGDGQETCNTSDASIGSPVVDMEKAVSDCSQPRLLTSPSCSP
ncbi:unnamed protein product [Discosporangium mesarthrocarpum]